MSAARCIPAELTLRARSLGKDEFVDSIATPFALLVTLPSSDGVLATGIRESFAGDFAPLRANSDAINFATRTRLAAPSSKSRPVRSFTVQSLVQTVARQLVAIVPVRRRVVAGRPYTERVLVGRARNNDVVLRDESVSKFHAWFEADEEGGLYLADARSKNGTSVNGVPLHGASFEKLSAADEVTFGAIQCSICSVEMIWQALHES